MTRRVAIAVAAAALVGLVVSLRAPLPESAPLAAARLARTRLVIE